MALSQSAQLSLATALFGVLSFVLAVLAELKKPPYGTPIQQGGGVVVCRFPRDPTVALGALSALAAACSAALGALAVFFPYGGRHVPRQVLLAHTPLYVFLHVAVGVTVAGVGTTVWATAAEAVLQVRNVHRDPAYACPTAETGVLGGAAFLNLDAMLFWVVCLMLVGNVRTDYFEDHGGDGAGAEEK
ncbi:uncharacterized protein LOC120701333 [Panicum virgatum]|uniref:Uncharacterized protein n=1 Tax=Panicum virgatum TaxID=38727 RepID=A0A8T0V1V1_PANVG|nr:uncharacterized protein LOC120701333 [Panicum virgatum]KAG2626923.1 hypothetical protein PVAP13_3KG484831 [Panicum virgatum]